jgi:hypothetical protein
LLLEYIIQPVNFEYIDHQWERTVIIRRGAKAFFRAVKWPPVSVSQLENAESISDLQNLVKDTMIDGFNGQIIRTKFIYHIFTSLNCTSFLETGTYHGGTSLMARELFKVPVYTVEVKAFSILLARVRSLLMRSTDVHFYHGDSRDFLRRMLSTSKIGPRPMIYLDAHWYHDHPLREEIGLVVQRGNCVVVIDDCRVPWDAGFGYEADQRFTIELNNFIDELPPERVVALQPAYPSSVETGGRRGALVLVIDLPLPSAMGPSADFSSSLFKRVPLIAA